MLRVEFKSIFGPVVQAVRRLLELEATVCIVPIAPLKIATAVEAVPCVTRTWLNLMRHQLICLVGPNDYRSQCIDCISRIDRLLGHSTYRRRQGIHAIRHRIVLVLQRNVRVAHRIVVRIRHRRVDLSRDLILHVSGIQGRDVATRVGEQEVEWCYCVIEPLFCFLSRTTTAVAIACPHCFRVLAHQDVHDEHGDQEQISRLQRGTPFRRLVESHDLFIIM